MVRSQWTHLRSNSRRTASRGSHLVWCHPDWCPRRISCGPWTYCECAGQRSPGPRSLLRSKLARSSAQSQCLDSSWPLPCNPAWLWHDNKTERLVVNYPTYCISVFYLLFQQDELHSFLSRNRSDLEELAQPFFCHCYLYWPSQQPTGLRPVSWGFHGGSRVAGLSGWRQARLCW